MVKDIQKEIIRENQLVLDAKTVGGMVMLESVKAILNGETSYFYQKCEVEAVVDAIAMPLLISDILDDCDEIMGWAIKLDPCTKIFNGKGVH